MRRLPVYTALVLALALAACDSSAPPAETASVLDGVAAGDQVSGSDWTWRPVAGMQCRSGTATGIGVRRAPAEASAYARQRLLIVLGGGGPCYGPGQCRNSPASFGAADFAAYIAEFGRAGLFESRSDNPFEDWNAVFLPNCTGDVHSGDTTDVVIPGLEALGPQQFVGYRNVGRVLDLIGGPARRAAQVALVGSGGGGFSTAGTYGLVAERLAPAPVYLLNDSGQLPPNDAVLTDSLQLLWRSLWNLATSASDCGSVCYQSSGDGLEHLLPYYADAYPDRGFGFISYLSDTSTRLNFGYLNPDCVLAPNGACLAPEAEFIDGVLQIRASLAASPNADTYYLSGRGHLILHKEDFYTLSVGGMPLTEWVRDVLSDRAVDVGPALPD